MGTINPTPTLGGSHPGYIRCTTRYTLPSPGYVSWSSITTGAGTGNGYESLTSQPHLYISGYNNLFSHVKYPTIALDLRGYRMVKFTAASVTLRIYDHTDIDPSLLFWEDASTYDDVVISGMDERFKYDHFSTDLDHTAVGYGFGVLGDYSNRIALNSLTDGLSQTWTINAAGLAYLNTVHDKTVYDGYAYLSVLFGGMSSGVTPTYSGSRTQRVNFDFAADTSISLTFDAPIQINVGDVWKEVVGVYINQTGSTWAYASDVNINVGDVWKDTV